MHRVVSVSTINRLTNHAEGEDNTPDYRVHAFLPLTADSARQRINLWHEVPLFTCNDDGSHTGGLNFICEIPKHTRRKFEIATKEPGNPIKQDEKNGKPRVFSKGDIFFNYGCFPRTWEDPSHVNPDVGAGGDNDPLDVCEIGLRQIPTATVTQVKVLGVICLIDDGEADWKVIAIDVNDRWAAEMHDINDVERLLPGTLGAIREWFRTYKMSDGKPENKFALGANFLDKAYAMRVIRETYNAWKKLVLQYEEPGLHRQLSVLKMDILDVESDHDAAASFLASPENGVPPPYGRNNSTREQGLEDEAPMF